MNEIEGDAIMNGLVPSRKLIFVGIKLMSDWDAFVVYIRPVIVAICYNGLKCVGARVTSHC